MCLEGLHNALTRIQLETLGVTLRKMYNKLLQAVIQLKGYTIDYLNVGRLEILTLVAFVFCRVLCGCSAETTGYK